MARTPLNIISVAEAEQFLSEKTLTGGKVTVVTLTNGSGFAAKNLLVYGQKVMFR